ncbi:MAG: hypothetical protein AAF385_13955 [Pseudomonadota bacterium]
MSDIDFEACKALSQEGRNQIYARCSARADFFTTLLDALQGGVEIQDVVTWFIKKHLEQGATADPAQVSVIYAHAVRITDWEATLHILQSIPRLGIPRAARKQAEIFIRRSLQSENKFVRAWAYNGFSELAEQYSAYREEASGMFAEALQHEAPSIKARIRNLTGFFGYND